MVPQLTCATQGDRSKLLDEDNASEPLHHSAVPGGHLEDDFVVVVTSSLDQGHASIKREHATLIGQLHQDAWWCIAVRSEEKDLRCSFAPVCKDFYTHAQKAIAARELAFESKRLNPNFITSSFEHGYIPSKIRMVQCTWSDIEGVPPKSMVSKFTTGINYVWSSLPQLRKVKTEPMTVDLKPLPFTTLQTLEMSGEQNVYSTPSYSISPIFLNYCGRFTHVQSASFQYLNLDQSHLQKLSEAIKNMGLLTSLSLEHTSLGSFPPFFDFNCPSSLTKLDIGYSGALDVQLKAVGLFTSLNWLRISGIRQSNMLETSPLNGQLLSSLHNLTFLCAYSCPLNDLKFIQNYTFLQSLDLRRVPFPESRPQFVARLITDLKPLINLQYLGVFIPEGEGEAQSITAEESNVLKSALPSLQKIYSTGRAPLR